MVTILCIFRKRYQASKLYQWTGKGLVEVKHKKAFLAPHDPMWQKITVRTTVHINIHRCVMSDWAYTLFRSCQYTCFSVMGS